MNARGLSVCVLGGLALAVAACATPTVQPVDWNRPIVPLTGKPPVLMHDMAIANPPHPQVRYADYEEEPTRYIFRPRNIVTNDDGTDNGTGDATVDQPVDVGGGDE